MMPTAHPMRPARVLLIPTPPLPKRKRTLCRRFLVSLGARRRTPTRLSLKRISHRRRRETRHDSVTSGGSSQYSPSKSVDSRIRTNTRGNAVHDDGARRAEIAFAAGPRNRSASGNHGRADGRPLHGPQAVSRGRGALQKAFGSGPAKSRIFEQAGHRSTSAGGAGIGAEIL